MYYSIALDESTDINDSAQVLLFIRLITSDFHGYEELLDLGSLTERTRGIDVLNLFKETLCKVNPNLSNLVSVCTDGAPSMIGKHELFVALLRRELSNPDMLISFHCILHQEKLCAKSLCWVIPWMEWWVMWITSERMQWGIGNFVKCFSMVTRHSAYIYRSIQKLAGCHRDKCFKKCCLCKKNCQFFRR